MRCRQNLWPRRFGDKLCFTTFFFFLPVCFMYNSTFILPQIHDPGTVLYVFTYFMFTFLVFNIIGNFLACWIIDTSVDVKKLSIPRDASNWRKCPECNYLMPPRSWHCKVCNCCVLKLNHHCLFTGNCIGHMNLRYFLMFVVYVFIGSSCALAYTGYYLWWIHWNSYGNWWTLLKLMAPHLLIFYGSSSSWTDGIHLLIFNLTVMSTICALGMCLYHFPIFLRGGVCHERRMGHYPYDSGNWRTNLREILGERMHLVWLSPLIESPLPSNGIDWKSVPLKGGRGEKQQPQQQQQKSLPRPEVKNCHSK